MGIRMLSIKEADWDAFHMSFFMFSTPIFALEISSPTPKESVLRRWPNYHFMLDFLSCARIAVQLLQAEQHRRVDHV
jgi:hypothetical protein